MKVLTLRLDAPLIAFGGTVVDSNGITYEMPARSMVTGLLGNALGYDHRDTVLLERLQARLRIGARRDLIGERLVDFQTVDLGQPHMLSGWTTWGAPESRGGGSAKGTHIRHRHYLADAVYTLALALTAASESPGVDDLARALDEPARPLFLGRKACLPSEPILLGVVESPSLLAALRAAPLPRRRRAKKRIGSKLLVRVPGDETIEETLRAGFSQRAVTEDRDWSNQIHVGRSFVQEGFVVINEQGAPS